MMTSDVVEWLEPDGLGGFASGTSTGIRTRRYHGLLLVATTPPTGRVMLVNGLEVWVDTPSGRYDLSSQMYVPDTRHPGGSDRIEAFVNDPWPTWTFRLPDGTTIEQEIFSLHGKGATAVTWRLWEPREQVILSVRPLLSGRDYHSLHRANGAFRFDATRDGATVMWHPYPELPAIEALSNGRYEHQPEWYRNFQYDEERTRGLDFVEDLASPGVLRFDLSRPAVLMFTTDRGDGLPLDGSPVQDRYIALREAERRRRLFPSVLHRGADGYLVRRGEGQTVVAGYPWFTDWGRDTFIALRGLCIATGQLDGARDILTAWADTVSEGMLPNRFPDSGSDPEFNAVDASLWYVIAVHEFLEAMRNARRRVDQADQARLRTAVEAIASGYAAGTRFGIRLDEDGLLASGAPGVQLTWMDSKIGDWVVTPRTGKPVEIQALWLNALWVVGQWSDRWRDVLARGTDAFKARFWNEAEGGLFDVIDSDHHAGLVDPAFRPNQIFAVGGLPLMLLDAPRARSLVDAVERRLLTPLGLRSLAPGSPGYAARYEGNGGERDARYHQGTVWPWLIGPFVEAWVRVRGGTAEVKREARQRFLPTLLEIAARTGGHLPEIADAEAPHTPRGCPCQAWSVAEVLRLELTVLARPARAARPTAARAESSNLVKQV